MVKHFEWLNIGQIASDLKKLYSSYWCFGYCTTRHIACWVYKRLDALKVKACCADVVLQTYIDRAYFQRRDVNARLETFI